MTRLNKQSSKKGIMLLLVLLILAMAMIFISAALLLTTSTRNRLYTNTEQSQARLTVTSASEAFYQALKRQEIPDPALLKWAGATPSSAGVKINLTANPAVPGMAGVSGNQTIVTIKRKTNELIWVDFETEIGAAKENVRMILKVPEEEKGDALMSNPFHFGGGDTELALNNVSLGSNAPAGADDNYIVVNGPATMGFTRAGGTMDSNLVVIGKDSSSKVLFSDNDTVFNKDIIFLGDFAMFAPGTNTGTKVNGNVIFIGNGSTSTANAVDYSNGKNMITCSNWYFVNRVANNKSTEADDRRLEGVLNTAGATNSTNKMAVVTSSDGTTYTWSTDNFDYWNGDVTTNGSLYKEYDRDGIPTALQTQIGLYMQDKYTKDLGFDSGIPSTASALKTFHVKDKAADVGVTAITSDTFISQYSYDTLKNDTVRKGIVPAGTYLISGGSPNWWGSNPKQDAKKTDVKYFFFDAQEHYDIYFASNYNLGGCVFVFINGQSETKEYKGNNYSVYTGTNSNLVLLPGVTLSVDSPQNGSLGEYMSGFASCSCLKYENAADCYSEISGSTILKTNVGYTVTKVGSNDVVSYGGSKYNGVQQVLLNIVGVKNNTVTIGGYGSQNEDGAQGSGAIVEANIGLYNPETDNTTSTIAWYHNINFVYGRMEANNFIIKNNSNHPVIPYPANPNLAGDLGDKIVETRFEIVDIIYYYD